MTTSNKGCLYGVGVGPGDPSLLTLKAHELIQQADVISYLANDKGQSQAQHIARISLAKRQDNSAHKLLQVPIIMPMSTDRQLANQAYDEGADKLASYLQQGLCVVFLCEGDPLFFGSFIYILERLSPTYSTQVVPGISSIHASAAALCQPLTRQDESLVITSGRQSDDQLRQALKQHASVVIMKAGRARPRILALLQETGRWQEAQYVEYVGRPQERIVTNLDDLNTSDTLNSQQQSGPYFSLFVVAKQASAQATPSEQYGQGEKQKKGKGREGKGKEGTGI